MKVFPKLNSPGRFSDVAAQAPVSAQTGGPAGTLDRVTVAPAAIEDQWAIVAQPGLKIGVKQRRLVSRDAAGDAGRGV
jgi:hypothetical protein